MVNSSKIPDITCVLFPPKPLSYVYYPHTYLHKGTLNILFADLQQIPSFLSIYFPLL